jgi:hypothetical protein
VTFNVLEDISIETPEGLVTFNQGRTIDLSKEDAMPMLYAGVITPTEIVAYKIYSNILQAYLWVTADDKDREPIRSSQGVSETIYTADEIKKLRKLSKEDLREIHKVKETFPESTIEEITRKVKN